MVPIIEDVDVCLYHVILEVVVVIEPFRRTQTDPRQREDVDDDGQQQQKTRDVETHSTDRHVGATHRQQTADSRHTTKNRHSRERTAAIQ